jgi:formylglycine-generating enzyme required for sulfatase activity
VELSWTAPGDDDQTGTAEEYDIRRSYDPIAEPTWTDATQISRRPWPKDPGRMQKFLVDNLTPGETYFFALKTVDRSRNWSEISNLATAVMTTPTISRGNVDPVFGDPGTLFTYEITYQDPENDPPVVHNIIIDTERFEMEEVGEGGSYVDGVVFHYQTHRDYGSHEYRFEFDDGHGPLLITAPKLGPDVPEGDPFDFLMVSVDVAGGASFTMGSPTIERGRENDETEHTVTLTRNFAIGETEVNQQLYLAVMSAYPSHFPSSARPVEQVTWYDAVKFCNALSALQELEPAYEITGERYDPQGRISSAIVSWDPEAKGYRLPTEAEWEHACRGGTTTALCNGDLTFDVGCDSVDVTLDAVGWYCSNSDIGTGYPKTRDPGLKQPNASGLYDMHGNVWEWCWDAYGEYPAGPVTDPTGPDGLPGDVRVRRGGSWFYFARDCRSASRGSFYPGSADNTVGFRLARNPD